MTMLNDKLLRFGHEDVQALVQLRNGRATTQHVWQPFTVVLSHDVGVSVSVPLSVGGSPFRIIFQAALCGVGFSIVVPPWI